MPCQPHVCTHSTGHTLVAITAHNTMWKLLACCLHMLSLCRNALAPPLSGGLSLASPPSAPVLKTS